MPSSVKAIVNGRLFPLVEIPLIETVVGSPFGIAISGIGDEGLKGIELGVEVVHIMDSQRFHRFRSFG